MSYATLQSLFARTFAGLVLFAGIAAHGQAAVIVHTEQAEFLAGVWQPGTDTFDDLASGASLAGPLARSAAGYGYRALVEDSGAVGDGGTEFFPLAAATGGTWLSTNFAASTMLFDQFGSNVRALGGLFFGTDVDGLALSGTTLLFTLVNAEGSTNYSLPGNSASNFVGFLSSSAIVSLSVSSLPGSLERWGTVDNLLIAEVPEPGSIALFALGALLLTGARRRR